VQGREYLARRHDRDAGRTKPVAEVVHASRRQLPQLESADAALEVQDVVL
jgi:hypothetical protein